ncbi:hypothetical protein BDV32DRAFT_148302 [Aspergillus pseudonomiae]|nr:hypothetical protein BDV32DRAFT_148302 [Aspergillus pseudonomiae]
MTTTNLSIIPTALSHIGGLCLSEGITPVWYNVMRKRFAPLSEDSQDIPQLSSIGHTESASDLFVHLSRTLEDDHVTAFITTDSVAKAFDISHEPSRGSTGATPLSSPFIEVQIPGKRTGLVASKDIRAGDVIISEKPAMVVHEGIDETDEENRLRLQWEAVRQLPREISTRLLDLLAYGDGDILDEILNTNSFGVTIPDSADHRAVFLQISRLNHACRPNAAYQFDPETLVQTIYAIDDIPPGEEITISYIDTLVPYTQRQNDLANWGFECTCQLCSLAPEDRVRSDRNIQSILTYKRALDDWSEYSAATTEMAEALIELVRSELTHDAIATAYRLAAYEFNAVGHKDGALEYAFRAFTHGCAIWRKRDAESNIHDVVRIMSAPEKHWTWMKRIGTCVA